MNTVEKIPVKVLSGAKQVHPSLRGCRAGKRKGISHEACEVIGGHEGHHDSRVVTRDTQRPAKKRYDHCKDRTCDGLRITGVAIVKQARYHCVKRPIGVPSASVY